MSVSLLLVEDEPLNRELFRAMVKRVRHPALEEATIDDAATLHDARSQLGSRSFDLVVIDVRLPDGNGLDLARELSDGLGEERPRIVILSASVLPGERSVALGTGADGFLGKPYSLADLTGLLTRVLGLA